MRRSEIYNERPRPIYRRGDVVQWRENPQYDHKPGQISVVRVGKYLDKNGYVDGYFRPTYKILGLGPFPYYWLDEFDICIPDNRIYILSTEEKQRFTLSHFRLDVRRNWTEDYKGLNIHAFVTAPIADLERLGYTFVA